jgi:hypothetical protein
MDHIPPVHDSSRGLEVPFLYDGDGFGLTGFPERSGFDEKRLLQADFPRQNLARGSHFPADVTIRWGSQGDFRTLWS